MSDIERRLRKIEASLEWMSSSDNILAEALDELGDRIEQLESTITTAGWMKYIEDKVDGLEVTGADPQPDSESAFLYLPEEKEFIRFVGYEARTPPHIVHGKWYEISRRLREERLGVMFYNERGLETYPSGPGWNISTYRGPYFVERRTDNKIDSWSGGGWWSGHVKQEAEWPRQGERVYFISVIDGRVIIHDALWCGDDVSKVFLGIYRTKEAAEEATGKIKRVMEHLRSGEHVILATDARMVTAEKVKL